MTVLFLVVFVDLLGFGIIIPLLPFYAESFQAGPNQVTWLMATYSLTQFVAAPFWGRLSDRIGRRPVLLLTLAGLAASYVWLGFAHSLLMLFAARAFGGLMAGNISAAFAYAADISTPENRAKAMGMIGAAFGVGFAAGPAIGGLLAGSDPAQPNVLAPALCAAGLSGAAFLLAIAILPESLSAEIRAAHAARPHRRLWTQFRQAMAVRDVGLGIGLAFLATFVFAGMESTFAMWSRRQFGWGPEQNGYLFACVGAFIVVIQGGLVGRLARRFGERNLILQGAVALTVGMGLIPLANSLPMLALAMVFLSYGFGVINPALNSLISRGGSREDQGGIMGVARSATTLARVVGPPWAGLLFADLGRHGPYLGGAAIMIVVAIIALRGLAPHRAPPPAGGEGP